MLRKWVPGWQYQTEKSSTNVLHFRSDFLVPCTRKLILLPRTRISMFLLGTGAKGSSDLLWSCVVRRPSSVRRPLNYLHFGLLQNRLMDFDETWYGWSTPGPLQVLLFFGLIRRGADPGRGKNRSRGVPFFKKLLQTGRLQRQTECIAVIKKHVGRSVVIFWFHFEVKFLTRFWRLFGLSQICLT